MALTKTRVTGRLLLPNDDIWQGSYVQFQLRAVDTDKADKTILMSRPVEAAFDEQGDIAVDLWPNARGDRDTVYHVTAHLLSPVTRRTTEANLGVIVVPAGGPVDLVELLQIPAPVPNVPDALAQALAAAVSAARDRDRTDENRTATDIAAQQAALAPRFHYPSMDAFAASDAIWPVGARITIQTGETLQRDDAGPVIHPLTLARYFVIKDGASAAPLSAAFVKRDRSASASAAFRNTLADMGTVRIGRGDYQVDEAPNVLSDTVMVFDKGATLFPDANGRVMLRIEGTPPPSWHTPATDIYAGTDIFHCTTASWEPGEWVAVRSNAPIGGTNVMGDRIEQILKVVHKQGNFYHTDRPFYENFLISDAATVGKPVMKERVVIDGIRLNRADNDHQISFGLYMRYVADFDLINPEIVRSKVPLTGDGSAGVSAIRMSQCVDGRIYDPVLGHIAWYGIAFGGFNDNIRVRGGRAWDNRHATSLVWGNGNPDSPSYGESHNITIDGMHGSDCTQAIFDTHDTGQIITFANCQAFRSRLDSGFQIRNRKVRIINPVAKFNRFDGIITRNDGGIDLLIENPDVAENNRTGLGLSGNGEPQVIGGYVGRNGSEDIIMPGGLLSGTRVEKTTGANVTAMRHVLSPDGVARPLVIEKVQSIAPSQAHIFCAASAVMHPLLRLRDNDLRGYGGNAYRTMIQGEPPHTIDLGGTRVSSDAVTRTGEFTLAAGGTATLDFEGLIHRAAGPAYSPEFSFWRTASDAAVADRGQIIIVQLIALDSGTRTRVVLKSSSPADSGTFRWTLIS